jgi:large subunit ribosomal protein L41
MNVLQLKPYVSYRAPEVVQSEFTSQDLFDAVYAKKIVADFKEGKLDANGDPIAASEEERLSPEEAVRLAKLTGSDLFNQEKGVDEKLKRFND